MFTHKPTRKLLVTALCALAVTFAAARADAADNTFKESAELGKKTAKTSDDVNKYASQLDKTEQALSSVSHSQGKDLRKQFQSFSRKLNNLEQAQINATSDIDGMKSTATEYFSTWDTSIEQISNPELKQASADRRVKVMKDHQDLASALVDIESQLKPFMSDLRDLKAFLEADLSPANADNASGMIQKSQTDADALKVKIVGVQTTLKQFLNEAPK